MPLYEVFREESTALIEAVVLNDDYWSRITSLPPKVTQGSDIKVYENCSTKNVVLKFVRTMKGKIRDLKTVISKAEYREKWDKQSESNIDICSPSKEFENIDLLYTKSKAQGPFSSRHTVVGTHIYDVGNRKFIAYSKSLNDVECSQMQENNVVMTIKYAILIAEQMDENTVKVIVARSLDLDLGYFIPIGRVRSRLAVIVPYSLHLASKLLLECSGNTTSKRIVSNDNPQTSSLTKSMVQKPSLAAVSNEELNHLKRMIQGLRAKLKYLEKLGFVSLTSIVIILLYNLFFSRRRTILG